MIRRRKARAKSRAKTRTKSRAQRKTHVYTVTIDLKNNEIDRFMNIRKFYRTDRGLPTRAEVLRKLFFERLDQLDAQGIGAPRRKDKIIKAESEPAPAPPDREEIEPVAAEPAASAPEPEPVTQSASAAD